MPYPAVGDRRIPYDADGSTVGFGNAPSGGITSWASALDMQHLNDYVDHGQIGPYVGGGGSVTAWFWFPEARQITGIWSYWSADTFVVRGSNDTTNGMDGTWTAATLGASNPRDDTAADAWRNHINSVSFGGVAYKTIRVELNTTDSYFVAVFHRVHFYGHKDAGQTVDDVLFMDSDGAGTEFTSPEDFGDRPLGTTVTRTFAVKNASATKTANNVVVACSDSDFIISADGGTTWVTSYTVTAIAAGATSLTFTTRDTTPGVGSSVGPRHARITATVTSWA